MNVIAKKPDNRRRIPLKRTRLAPEVKPSRTR